MSCVIVLTAALAAGAGPAQVPDAEQNRMLLSGLVSLAGAGKRLEADEPAKALPLAKKALGAIREVYGERHSRTVPVMETLATIYEQMGQTREALSLRRKALAVRSEMQGELHAGRLRALWRLGALLTVMRQHKEALPLLMRAEELIRLYGASRLDHAGVQVDLATWCIQAGHPHSARKPLEAAVKVYREEGGAKHPRLADALWRLGDARRASEGERAALRIYEEALAAGQVAFGPKHPWVGRALYELADVMLKTGKAREALQVARRAVEVYKEALGEGHPEYLVARAQVERINKRIGR